MSSRDELKAKLKSKIELLNYHEKLHAIFGKSNHMSKSNFDNTLYKFQKDKDNGISYLNEKHRFLSRTLTRNIKHGDISQSLKNTSIDYHELVVKHDN